MQASRNVTQSPRGRDRFVTFNRQAVYYQDGNTTVTSRYFQSDGYRYPVAELIEIERVEHGSWLQARAFELWARFRGQRVRLFLCYNARQFGQVCRALTRARERLGLA
jgi:hypothetical protein